MRFIFRVAATLQTAPEGVIDFRFQTKTDVQALLAEAGARPRHRWGQNFLIDGNLLRRLLTAAEIAPEDAVLEVGAGTGAVTDYLAEAAAAVVVVEIDPLLHELLDRRFSDRDNVTLLHGDVLTGKHEIRADVCDACRRAAVDVPGRLMLVANLPYNVATPLLIELLLDDCPFERFCFTVQRELADRFCASDHTKDYGPLTIIVHATCRVKRLAVLPPSVFWPRPKVESAMLRLDVDRNPFETPDGLRAFAELVHGGFAHRRKTLRYNLSRVLDDDALRTVEDEFDLSLRPEAIDVATWVHLGRRVVATRT